MKLVVSTGIKSSFDPVNLLVWRRALQADDVKSARWQCRQARNIVPRCKHDAPLLERAHTACSAAMRA